MSGEERNGQVKKEKKGLRMQVVFCDPLILLFHYVSRNRPDQKFKLWVLKTFRHIKVNMRNSQMFKYHEQFFGRCMSSERAAMDPCLGFPFLQINQSTVTNNHILSVQSNVIF